jgi:hypothetical protein
LDITHYIIETLGWIGSVLIVGAFGLNSLGKIKASSMYYQLANMVGGIFFVVNTYHHKAYPSALVNVIWVFIAGFSLLRKKKENA